ncbi:MAG: hypothetical protein MI742_01030 [Desulfobacterales bacterium]|nr:hypothetical protein [Desulfobacterales bacterium]
MRRCLIFLVLSLIFAAPALALDLDISGSLQFEGVYNDKAELDKNDSADSYREMRLRVLTEAQVTKNLKIITRFDALDKVLSSTDSAFDQNEDDDNIDFDRAYAELTTPIGLLSVGRMQGVVWGTTWSDDEADTDRIKLVTPIPINGNKLYVGVVAEKVTENDKGTELSSKDNDKYYIGATYKTKNYRAGLLSAFYNFHKFQDPGQAVAYKQLNDLGGATKAASEKAKATAFGTTAAYYSALATAAADDSKPEAAEVYTNLASAAQTSMNNVLTSNAALLGAAQSLQATARGTTCEAKVYLLAPYFDGKFGPFGFKAELDYAFGEAEYQNNTERDVSAHSWFAEGTYEMGPFSFELGYGTVTGGPSDLGYTGDLENMGYVAPGVDWAKAFILTNDVHNMNTTLGGGLGNLVGDGFGTGYVAYLDGYQMFYAGAQYKCHKDVTLGVLLATSQADYTPAGVDDDHGIEYDFNFTWEIFDHLTYSATAAFLDAGDYWKERATSVSKTTDGEDTYALYHKLVFTF